MKRNILIMLLISFVLLIAGCGNNNTQENDKQTEDNAKEEKITVTDLQGNTVEFNQPPKNIVSLTAGDLETIYALGGEAVGRPVIRGEVPEYLKDLPEVGTTNEVNIEKIISLQPDLVIAHPQLNAKDIPLLENSGVKVLQTGAGTVDEIKQSIEMIGEVLQKEDKAKELTGEIDEKIKEFDADPDSGLRSLIVFGVAGNFMAALPNSLSGNMLEVVDGYNIAKDFPKLDRFPQYAQLDTEKIVEANPKAIFLISPGPSKQATEGFLKQMEQNPIWNNVDAVKNGHIINLPNELFGASPGAKIIESLEYLHEQIQAVENNEQ